MGRPFGVALLFGGVDKTGPKLYHLDPSGTFIDCLAKAIGAASDGAEQTLKEKYHDVSFMFKLKKKNSGNHFNGGRKVSLNHTETSNGRKIE